jgi:hypothetical protein
MTPLDHVKGILGLSCGFWIIYGVYISIRIERFIVKRYEQETDLLNTVFFKKHATFTRSLPDFFSSSLYNAHLLMCVWGWRLYKNRKMFRDIDNPKIVTQHFSTKEIRQAKWFLISGIAFILHGAAYYIFSLIWPDVFD